MASFKIYIFLIIIIFLTPIAIQAEEVGMETFLGNGNGILVLKILTLNIHSSINWNGNYDLEGIINFIKDINPDIVGLQEVDRFWSSTSPYQDTSGELALRLNMYPVFSASRQRNDGYFGNLILSKYPIIQVWTEVLPGSLEPRSFAFAQILFNGFRLNFVTTHLGLSVSDRLLQTSKLIEFVNQVSGPLIITGDFNGGEADLAVANLKRRFLDLQELSDSKDLGTFRQKDGSIGSKMDYILTTPEFGFTKLQIVENYISDHLPIIAEVYLQISQPEIAGEPVSIQPGFL